LHVYYLLGSFILIPLFPLISAQSSYLLLTVHLFFKFPAQFGTILSVLYRANILWLGMRPQIDESSKTTAIYPPIAVDQKDRSGRGICYKSRNFLFMEVLRVASASSELGEGCPHWRRGSSCPPFLLSSSGRPSLVVLANYRMSKQLAFFRLFLHL